MSEDKPEKPDLPETLEDAETSIADESYYVPMDDLPADPDALQKHIGELYLELAKTKTAAEYSTRMLRWQLNKQAKLLNATVSESDGLSDRGNDAMDRLGYHGETDE